VLDSIRWYADGGERYDAAAGAGSDAEGATAPGDVVVERSQDEES